MGQPLVNQQIHLEISLGWIFFSYKLSYSIGMDSISLRPGQWQMTIAPKSFSPSILSLIGELAKDSPILVLDGGNQCNALEIAEAVMGDEMILRRIRISRAFNCYQLTNLLESTWVNDKSILLLDFLSTFYDESAPFVDRSRLLSACISNINRLNRTNGLLLISHPPTIPSPQASSLIKKLEATVSEKLPPEILIQESENMGKTIPAFAQVFDKIQNSFSKFRRNIRPPEQLIFDTLFRKARNHLASASLAARSLPFETILFCMILEQQKELNRLQEVAKNQGKAIE